MKRISLLLLMVVTMLSAYGQAFEGKITYKNTYKGKTAQVNSDQLNKMMGTKMEYFIKGANYKSSANGEYFQWQLYIGKENKLYSKTANSDIAVWNDGSINGDTVRKATINKKAKEVMGYMCDELVLVCKSGTRKFYYNAKIAANPKLFVNHKYGNWYDYVSRAKALPLLTTIENEQFSLESIATEITPMKLDDKTFEIPAGVKTQKNPY